MTGLRTAILALGLTQACAAPAAPEPGGGGGEGGVGGAVDAVPTSEAGFVEAPSRDVVVRGQAAHIAADAELFYNFQAADVDAETRPIFVLFNGFSANVVRGFGTGRRTVAEGGDLASNAASLTAIANLLYVEPRQAGFSYDVGGDDASCSPAVFNEYVDAADVLFAVLGFLDAHPALKGPVLWVGESYAGVRIQWLLSYLRGAWSLAPYEDPTLEDRVAEQEPARLLAGQILLDPWLLGKAHADAIAEACTDPATLAAVSESVGVRCVSNNACACATANARSLYNYTYTAARQETRIAEANAAHVSPAKAELLLGVALDSIPGLAAAERSKGFKCDRIDANAPPQGELFSLLGPLPDGQAYFLPYSPLQPGKELEPTPADWRDLSILGPAFVDNLRDVPTFVTDGARDLVVPFRALAPALRVVAGSRVVNEQASGNIDVLFDDGPRTIAVGTYPAAGHMITMIEPAAFEQDVAAWLAALP